MSGKTKERLNPVKNRNGIITVLLENFYPNPKGLGCAIFDKMKEFKYDTVQVDGSTGEEDTYESLLKRCVRTAIVMRSRGVSSEDIISICSNNNLNSCVPFIAALFVGAKVACLDPSNSLADSIHLLNKIKPKIIFVGPEAVKLIEDAIEESQIVTEIVVFDDCTEHSRFAAFLECDEEKEGKFQPTPAENIQDTAVIMFSAGTTGMPKGICMSHSALLDQAYHLLPLESVEREDIHQFLYLSFTSLYWTSTSTLLLVTLLTKRSIFIFSKFSAKNFWTIVEKNKVNLLFLTPQQLNKVCKKVRKPRAVEIKTLRRVIITGSPILKPQILELKNILPGVIVRNVYGISEAGGYAIDFRPSLFHDDERLINLKPDSCGRPRRGFSCKVVDNETGEILGPHQRGELRLKSRFQMNGYYDMDSSSAWDPDGWLKTGDTAYYDEENCFYIVDRIKEMLHFRKWHVAPSKVESVLKSHPAVEAAVVVGLPHPEDGEHPVGVVVLRRCAVGTVTAEDIEFYVDQRVDDRYRLRGGIRIVDYIPVTPTGNYRRRDIREFIIRELI